MPQSSTASALARKYIPRLQRELGISEEAAAALMGNFAHETANFTVLHNPNSGGGDGVAGWAHWRGDRQRLFREHAGAMGVGLDDPEANYTFVVRELGAGPQGTADPAFKKAGAANLLDTLRAGGDIADLSDAVETQYERSGQGFSSRRTYSNKMLGYAGAAETSGRRENADSIAIAASSIIPAEHAKIIARLTGSSDPDVIVRAIKEVERNALAMAQESGLDPRVEAANIIQTTIKSFNQLEKYADPDTPLAEALNNEDFLREQITQLQGTKAGAWLKMVPWDRALEGAKGKVAEKLATLEEMGIDVGGTFGAIRDQLNFAVDPITSTSKLDPSSAHIGFGTDARAPTATGELPAPVGAPAGALGGDFGLTPGPRPKPTPGALGPAPEPAPGAFGALGPALGMGKAASGAVGVASTPFGLPGMASIPKPSAPSTYARPGGRSEPPSVMQGAMPSVAEAALSRSRSNITSEMIKRGFAPDPKPVPKANPTVNLAAMDFMKAGTPKPAVAPAMSLDDAFNMPIGDAFNMDNILNMAGTPLIKQDIGKPIPPGFVPMSPAFTTAPSMSRATGTPMLPSGNARAPSVPIYHNGKVIGSGYKSGKDQVIAKSSSGKNKSYTVRDDEKLGREINKRGTRLKSKRGTNYNF